MQESAPWRSRSGYCASSDVLSDPPGERPTGAVASGVEQSSRGLVTALAEACI